MKKRVAILVPGGVGGGLFDQGIPALVNLIQGLSEKYDITVYSLISVTPGFKPSNFKIRAVNARYDDWTPRRVLRLLGMVVRDHLVKKYDLFHGFWGVPCGTLAVKLGKLFNKPSVVSLQGGEAANLPEINYGYLIKNRKKRRLFRTMNAASAVTALTQFQGDRLLEAGYNGKKFTIIPYGVDTSLFQSTMREYSQPIRFIHVANLTVVKDQLTLLKAFKIITQHIPAKLQLVGYDDMNGAIQRLCCELDLEEEVQFIGSVRHGELPSIFKRADFLLHTSLYESQAVVVCEAMASGTMVAGTRVGLLSDLEGYMIVSRVGDHEELAKRVLDALADLNNLKTKVAKAHEWALINDSISTTSRFDELYKRLMNSQ